MSISDKYPGGLSSLSQLFIFLVKIYIPSPYCSVHGISSCLVSLYVFTGLFL